MPRIWRWDQGRLHYFAFDSIRTIARTVADLEGAQLNVRGLDPLRHHLEAYTGLPFLPRSYKVWRNYKRVFECAFLATNLAGRLVVTDICRRFAGVQSSAIDVDEYFSLLIPRFSFPFPAFNDYDSQVDPVYPFCAVLKYLIANFQQSGEANISLDDVFSLIIANDCNGTELLQHYLRLERRQHRPRGDRKRQVREMLIFVSQFSILKWYNGKLYLDISPSDLEDSEGFQQITTPIVKQRKATQAEEFLSLTSFTDEVVHPVVLPTRAQPTEHIFTEGRRVRLTHLRIERSPVLRRLFFARLRDPLCDMCSCRTRDRYPWTENLLEIHHILPLSSTLSITDVGTSLEYLTALCPTCHKGVHAYYKMWLSSHSLDDFRTHEEAKQAYIEAKGKVRL